MSSPEHESDEIFGKYANGTLDLSICKDANNRENSFVCNLNISVDSSDFYALQTDILRNGNHQIDICLDEIDGFKIYEQNRKRFQRYFPNFEILGRFYDDYEDYVFNQNEVETLLSECLEAKPLVSGKKAELFLRKIIYACNQTLEEKNCLVFVCD
jgi:hypothetical protein